MACDVAGPANKAKQHKSPQEMDYAPAHECFGGPVKQLSQASCACVRGAGARRQKSVPQSGHHLRVWRVLCESGRQRGWSSEKNGATLRISRANTVPNPPHLSSDQRDSNLPFSCLGPVIQCDTLICGNHRGLLRPASGIYDRLRLPQMHISLLTPVVHR